MLLRNKYTLSTDNSQIFSMSRKISACGSVITMKPSRFGGVGIAYSAQTIGHTLPSTHIIKLKNALTLKSNDVGIYAILFEAHPWVSMDPTIKIAIAKTAIKGRDSKGCVYVISAGGRSTADERSTVSCVADAFVNHAYTLPIGQASRKGKVIRSDRCAAVIATAYSSRPGDREGVVAYMETCERSFGGPEAATSIAAGIIANVLSSKPSLTPRDVMHLIAMGSEVAPLADNGDTWHRNGAGFWVSNDFGFGLLNAANMVNLAETFTTLPDKHVCSTSSDFESGKLLAENVLKLQIETEACHGTNSAVSFLEQIEVRVFMDVELKEVLTIDIVSPQGTTTSLMERDSKRSEMTKMNWSFKSYHNWGESPAGSWKLIVRVNKTGVKLKQVDLVMRGTEDRPSHYNSAKPFRTNYSAFRLRNKNTSEDPLIK